MPLAPPTKSTLAALLLSAALLYPGATHAALPMPLSLTAAPAFLTLPGVSAAAPTPLFTSPAASILPAAYAPAAFDMRLSAPSTLPASWTPPGMDWLWNRSADPSLNLAGWDTVFNIARLGVYAVPLRDDPAERANIVLAARAVDSTTIMPGGTFSFNAIVGERTPERGFEDGLMFTQGQIVRGTGGGICLVSTGLYNAALQAGLTISERHGHSGVVSYAAPGCDASVVYGAQDMQFVNTTRRPIIIKTTIGENQVLVSLYGTPPPANERVYVRTTSLSTIPAPTHQTADPLLPPASLPIVDQKPRAGYHVVVERLWTRGNRIVRRETIADETRAPRPKRVRVPVPIVPPASPLALPIVPPAPPIALSITVPVPAAPIPDAPPAKPLMPTP